MPSIVFVESLSADPVERALAERVAAILGNPRLSLTERRLRVQRAQAELLAHRRQRDNVQAPPPRPARRRAAAADPISARRRELGLPEKVAPSR